MTRTSDNSSDAGTGVRIVRVADDRDGQRIDNFLAGQLKGVPKSLIYRILRTGQVRVNGKRAKPDTRLVAADEVRIPPVRVAEREETGAPARGLLDKIGQSILFEDKEFLVLNKPAGIAAHGGSGVSHGAIELLRTLRPKDTLELVHRLDRDTSGVLVLARKRSALTGLQELIRENRTTKQYLCLLQGHLSRASRSVNAPLRKSVLQGGERMVRVDEEGKPSLTHFKVIELYEPASLVEATLETGRTHQIRVHSQHMGHPIAGDDKYGDPDFNKAMRSFGLRRLFLHAKHFGFELGGKARSFSAPLADDLSAVLDKLPAPRRARQG
ncbi:23S rRNA pseudouridine(955/2504/2580) synthase RluC [Tahibacter amnicola]|uniref:Pseudouridine synthase n=1 Tax=Tahibacter amnicola TaxID=2976241 RepID=A0ABY6BAP0_9GAMM|nr:23S rRNA pseudouridine(955/2504/2580) synthase RluC [Tahibacter amnicola]UXI67133.1 23S rRNA pseudouridine(955/2504/2580) synthase RluC [Tahibacter amnicola]